MASKIALPLTNLLLGLGNIGAGIGFGIEEKKKMDELDKKSKKLQDSAAGAGNLYDHIYYLVAVNLERVNKSFDKIPSDLLKKVQKQIVADISDSDLEKVIKVIATVVNYTDIVIGFASAIVDIVIAIRERKASGQEPPEPPGKGPFENVPGSGEAPPTPSGGESSIPESPKLKRLSKGLQIGGIVFGVAGLAMTIGLGVWTLEKLDKAISDVEEKQKQVDAFQKAMTDVLDPIVKDAGLPAKSYNELIKMGEGWKKISENFDSYEKSFCFAISGFFMKKSLADIKSTVKKRSDQGKPFPEDGYALAETLAGDIKYQFDQKKTDKEVVAFFATENPKVGLRFVFNEYFISSLH